MSANSQGSFRSLPALAAILVLIALGAGLVFAQASTASMTGTVRDASGAIVPGAAISAKHVDTGLTRTAQSDAAGNYTLVSIPVGEYEVTAERMGFRREIRRGINLAVAQEALVDMTLQVGSIEQAVTVTGEAPLVNTTLASTSGLITESHGREMRLNGRGFEQLLTLDVGVSNGSSSTLNSGAWNMFRVSGKVLEANC